MNSPNRSTEIFSDFAVQLKPVPLDVEGWPDDLYVKQFTASEYEVHADRFSNKDDEPTGAWIKRSAYWCCVGICDVNGNNIFNIEVDQGPLDSEGNPLSEAPNLPPEEDSIDVQKLMGLPLELLKAAGDKIIDLNGMSKDSEDAEKND